MAESSVSTGARELRWVREPLRELRREEVLLETPAARRTVAATTGGRRQGVPRTAAADFAAL